VLRRCEIFNAGGGFVFNTIQQLQARVPVANMVAMFEAIREFNGTVRKSASLLDRANVRKTRKKRILRDGG